MAREMKDSGIEWIGKIPIEWEAKKNKSLFYEVNERCENGKEHTLLAVSEYYGIAPRSEKIQEGEYETRATTLDGYKICKCGDIVMNIMLAWKRSTARSGYDGIVSPAYCVFRKRSSDVDTKFFHYLFRTHICADMFKRYSTGIIDSRLRLYPDVFMQLYSIVPPISEQHRIADFLDRKCAEIDRVLEKTRASIEEYKKLKQSVITQAVTKGIRGEREMKDSGIEWIGEIPAEWKISRIKYVSSFEPPCDTSRLSPDSVITYTPMEYIKNGYYVPNTATLSSLSTSLTSYQSGDIVMAKVTPCFENGNISIMNNLSSDFGLGSSELFVFRAKSIHTPFLFYWLRNNRFVQTACSTMTGTGGLKRVSSLFVKDSSLAVPPESEQIEIANYLDKKCSEIDTLISKKEQFITELESYKKSLIYEYVTGKKEAMNDL